MTLVLAHAGHWLEGVAVGAPVVLVPAAMAVVVVRDRLRRRHAGVPSPP